jgi:hypothetical protein
VQILKQGGTGVVTSRVASVVAKLAFVVLTLYLGSYQFRSFSFHKNNVTMRAFDTEAEARFFAPAIGLESLLCGAEVLPCGADAMHVAGHAL